MRKIKNYLLIGMLLFGITFVVTSCKDDFENQDAIETKKSPFSMRTIYGEELNQKQKIFKQINTFNKKSLNKSGVYNEQYDFTIETAFAKYIESEDNSFHTYTFLVHREEDNGLLENLVFTSQPDGTYETELVAYDFIDENTIEIKKATISLNSDDYLNKSYSFSWSCTTTITYITTIDPNCNCEFVTILSVETNCTFNYFSTLDTGSSGGSGGSGGFGAGIWTGGSSGGTSAGNPDIATSLVTTDAIQSLEEQTCDPQIKARIEQMQANIPTNTNEEGSEFRRNDNGFDITQPPYTEISVPDYNTTPTSVTFENPVFNTELLVHLHLNDNTPNDDAIQELVPSFEDVVNTIGSYLYIKNLSDKKSNLDNFATMIVRPNRIYAIKILDATKAQDFYNSLNYTNASGETYKETLQKVYDFYVNETAHEECLQLDCDDMERQARFEYNFKAFFRSLKRDANIGLGLFISDENQENNDCLKWEFAN